MLEREVKLAAPAAFSLPDLEDVAREHEPLVEAIEAGDEAAAGIAMQEHVMSTVGSLITRLGGSPEDLISSGPPRLP